MKFRHQPILFCELQTLRLSDSSVLYDVTLIWDVATRTVRVDNNFRPRASVFRHVQNNVVRATQPNICNVSRAHERFLCLFVEFVRHAVVLRKQNI